MTFASTKTYLIIVIGLLGLSRALPAAGPAVGPGGGASMAKSRGAELIASYGLDGEDKRPYSLLLDTAHYLSTTPEAAAYTAFLLDASYKVTERNRLQVKQIARKLYEVPIGETEVPFSDMQLAHHFLIAKDLGTLKWSWATGITLPVSKLSQDNGVITVASGALTISRAFLNEKIKLAYIPGFKYHFNEYTTTKGGTPLRQMSLSHRLQVMVSPIKELTFAADVIGGYHWNEKMPSQTTSLTNGGNYTLDLSVNYDFTKNIGVRVGYEQSDSMVKDGRYEMLFYDYAKSRFYLGLTLSI